MDCLEFKLFEFMQNKNMTPSKMSKEIGISNVRLLQILNGEVICGLSEKTIKKIMDYTKIERKYFDNYNENIKFLIQQKRGNE